ncbi:MAG: acyltransferase [Dehalococcoidia bacterium]
MPPATTAATPSRRMPELDVLRGLAIVFVVYLHAYFRPWDVTPNRHKVAMHVIHLFAHAAVPAFLFMSGLLLARERNRGLAAFASRKLLRIGLPVAIWMTAALAYRLWREDTPARDLLADFVQFDISGQYYYVLVLITFYAALYPFRALSARTLGLAAIAAFAANLGTIAWYQWAIARHGLDGEFATWAYRNPLAWAAFPVAGLWAGRLADPIALARRVAPAALAAMVVLMALYLYRGEHDHAYPVSYFSVVTFLFSCCAIPAALAAIAAGLPRRAFAFLHPIGRLGRYAFAIYLVHMPFFVGYVTETFISDSRVQDDYWKLMNGIFVTGFATSFAAVWLAARILGPAAGPLLGVEPAARPAPGPIDRTNRSIGPHG